MLCPGQGCCRHILQPERPQRVSVPAARSRNESASWHRVLRPRSCSAGNPAKPRLRPHSPETSAGQAAFRARELKGAPNENGGRRACREPGPPTEGPASQCSLAVFPRSNQGRAVSRKEDEHTPVTEANSRVRTPEEGPVGVFTRLTKSDVIHTRVLCP